MKHLSHKIVASLLVGGVALSSVNASGALAETSRVVSSARGDAVRLADPGAIISSIDSVGNQLKEALLAGAKAQDEAERLRAEAAVLKFKNAVLEAQKKEKKAEKLSLNQRIKNWFQKSNERIRNWFAKIDATKVVTTIISGLLTLAGTLLVILL
jgi:hypothetical protein